MNSFLSSFRESFIVKLLLIISTFLFSLVTNAQVDKNLTLYKTLKAKDSIVFDNVFNKCNIQILTLIIADNFEFYHDVVGIQDKNQFLEAVTNTICSYPENHGRQLIKESLEVFALKKNGELYGAIQTGKHTFQEKQNDVLKTVGIADFTHLWILENKIWKLKKVLSYNHKPYTE